MSFLCTERLENIAGWRLDPRVSNRLIGTGFEYQQKTLACKHDNRLLEVVANTFDPARNTFNFNGFDLHFGLKEVLYITGLHITGKPVTGSDVDSVLWSERCFGENLCKKQRGKIRSSVKLADLKSRFMELPEHVSPEVLDRHARAYVLYVIGSSIFSNSNRDEVPTMYLPLLCEVTQIKEYAWGAAALAHLFCSLRRLKESKIKSLDGTAISLQIFVMLSLPRIKNFILGSALEERDGEGQNLEFPLIVSWSRILEHPSKNTKKIAVSENTISTITPDEVVYNPYEALSTEFLPGPFRVQERFGNMGTPLINFNELAWHMPELCSSNMILNLHSRAGPKGKDWKMATNQHQKSLQMWEESPFNQRPPHVIECQPEGVNEIEDHAMELDNVHNADPLHSRTIEKKKEKVDASIRTEEEGKRAGDEEVSRLIKELDDKNMENSALKQELETMKQTHELQIQDKNTEILALKQEFEIKEKKYEEKLKLIQKHVTFQSGCVQKLKLSWDSIKQDYMKEQRMYAEECNRLDVNLKPIVDEAESHRLVLADNRKLFNEIQELRGNIRVYCRIRPGEKDKESFIQQISETDLVVTNPSKQGNEAIKTFKFNKVFGPTSTQVEVYNDIQDSIRSVLDGFNVCIIAYGHTGSGKTYTMSGPNGATTENLGVNYRALNDLFSISSSRESSIAYNIGVQIIEIYNDQLRDLLSVAASPKKLGILSHPQPNGLAVPDARMCPVKSPTDVIKLIEIGLKNRATGATALNKRRSRSHSVVSIHVRGLDKKTGSSLQGNLHLVDLAGSERVDRSEVKGDRLKEAQHINKSLFALGDVIFAIAQKRSHVPYRNSKLTQLLQTFLGGQAKTHMIVQINSDIKSYSESLNTLKFAERVSGVELGAAQSTKEVEDVRELIEQMQISVED